MLYVLPGVHYQECATLLFLYRAVATTSPPSYVSKLQQGGPWEGSKTNYIIEP